MTEEEKDHLIRVGSTAALANKAILCCMLAKKPITQSNAFALLVEWMDPASTDFEEISVMVGAHLTEVIRSVSGAVKTQGSA